MHLEHIRDYLVRGGHEWWRVSMAGTRVLLGFTHPFRANGTNDLMPRSMVSKLCYVAPMNGGTLWVLASSEIDVPNPNGMWSLKNEIGYSRSRNHHPIEFDVSSIALTSSNLWPSEIDLKTHLEHLGDSSVWGGRRWWMVSMAGTRMSLWFTYPPRANGTDD